MTESLLRLRGKGDFTSAETLRAAVSGRVYPEPCEVPRGLLAHADVVSDSVDGWQTLTFTPHARRTPAHVIYTHGGAYVMQFSRAHWSIVTRLLTVAGVRVTIPFYPLAPEYTHQDAYRLLEQVYERALAGAAKSRVVLCGDSAGGGLALGQAHHLRDQGYPMPSGVVLFSPWLDLTLSNPAIHDLERVDVLLSHAALAQAAQWWSAGEDPAMPLLSPVFGDLSGLPPVCVFQGSHDLGLSDVRLLERRMTDAGGRIDVYEYPGAIHAFVAATQTPESRDVFTRVARYLHAEPDGSRPLRASARSEG